MLKKLISKFTAAHFLKYLVVGFLGTGLDFLILYLLVQYGHIYYLLAAIISVVIVLWFSFTLNKYWTFGNYEKKYFQQFAKYALSHAIALAINLIILVTLVSVFHLWYLVGKIFSTAAAAITNFLLVKSLIFVSKPSDLSPDELANN